MDRQCSSCGGFCKKSGCERENAKPVKPKEWQNLTDSEAEEIVEAYWHDVDIFIEAIEAKLKEKNT